MKILSLALLLMASVAIVLLGCSDNSTAPVAPTDKSLPSPGAPVALEKGGGVVHSATGGGHVSDFWGQEVKWTFSFTAKQYAGEIYSGQVQFVGHDGTKFHGTIINLNVVDNKAKLCWTYSSGPWTGMFGCAVVVDNGEGKKAAGPDMMSGFLWTDGSDIGSGTITGITAMSPDEFIDWLEDYLFPIVVGLPPGLPALVPTSNGNVQVR